MVADFYLRAFHAGAPFNLKFSHGTHVLLTSFDQVQCLEQNPKILEVPQPMVILNLTIASGF